MVELFAALRGGITQAAVRQAVPNPADPSQALLPGPAEVPPVDGALSTMPAGSLSLYRRTGRRLLRLIRPLALPFLVRLQRRISLGVDESRSAQLLQQLLARQNDINARLDRMTMEMQSLQSAVQQTRDALQQSVRKPELPIARSVAEKRTGDERIDALRPST